MKNSYNSERYLKNVLVKEKPNRKKEEGEEGNEREVTGNWVWLRLPIEKTIGS